MLAKPPRLDDDLAAAKAELEFAAECAATYMNRRVESKRHMVEDRHEYAQGRATEIWGGIKIGLGEEVYPNDPPSCAREKVQAALLRAGTRLEMAEQSIAEATEPLAHGAWVGAFRLCRDTVARVEIGKSDWNGEPELRLALTESGRVALAGLTERAVTENLAIRVDGGVISEPFIAEPLRDRTFNIQARDPRSLDRIRTLAADAC
jgi:preprotein translocase subunit SecD